MMMVGPQIISPTKYKRNSSVKEESDARPEKEGSTRKAKMTDVY